ncbi:MAG: Coenzyme F420 hydrogenase/dehydrogenase, beta subunit C-terminal domain [Prevotella sp.]|nr:Coenzyme F420 hydrogenase/dehydrogenase, beta subunit C-terminal domain [Prevotella sp.]
MINITDKSKCCGCTACANVCAHDAITMLPDAFGFFYPKVAETKCVDCGLCDKVCAFNGDYDKSLNLPMPDVYGARHKDMYEVMKSRSGAVFAAISDYVMEQGGVVYGAGYKDHFRVAHKRATTKIERDEFRGSKYVQSDLTGVFKQVKEDLRNGLLVLFSGTPCQTAGLNSYIGKKLRNNLILVDIVCHGVPSPFIWHDYLEYIEKKYSSKIVSVDFRNKLKYGWKAHIETFGLANGKVIDSTLFTKIFYAHIMFRHSCGNCYFCNTIRPSDLTLADMWDKENYFPKINNDNKGESLLLINTEKGREIFEAIKDGLQNFKTTVAKLMQPNLKSPSKINPKRIHFEKDYINSGFYKTIRKYGFIGWKAEIKSVIKIISRIKRKIKKSL